MRTKEQNREYMREYKRRRKMVTSGGNTDKKLTPEVTRDVTVTPDVTLPEGWDHVREYISVSGNLAKMRAVCGSLGRDAGSVRFGAYGPTAQEIGAVIGAGASIVTPAAPPVRYIPPLISVHDLLVRAAHAGRP